MLLERFPSTLPESLLSEHAVCAMNEGDDRIKLPMGCGTIGLPFFERLIECRRILKRQYDSACDFETDAGQMAAL